MTNLTLTVDEETLRRARIRALELGTSVNALVREYLKQLAGRSRTAEGIAEFSRRPRMPGRGADPRAGHGPGMTCMTGKTFIDSDILICSVDTSPAEKAKHTLSSRLGRDLLVRTSKSLHRWSGVWAAVRHSS